MSKLIIKIIMKLLKREQKKAMNIINKIKIKKTINQIKEKEIKLSKIKIAKIIF